MSLYTYKENRFGHITLIPPSPSGETVYLQVDTDIDQFREDLEAIENLWVEGERTQYHPAGYICEEQEISDMISQYFNLE